MYYSAIQAANDESSDDDDSQPNTTKARRFFGSVDIPAASARMSMVQVADEVIQLLCSDPEATVSVSIEIIAEFPEGPSDQICRAAIVFLLHHQKCQWTFFTVLGTFLLHPCSSVAHHSVSYLCQLHRPSSPQFEIVDL